MIARWALAAGVALVTAGAAMGPAFPHSGGSTGFASIAIGRESIRYSLTLWPSALPPEVAQELLLARAGRAASRDRLLGFIHDKITLVVEGRRCEAGPGSLSPPSSHGESVTLVVDFACAVAVRDLLIRDDLFDVLGADYHTLARIEAPGFGGQFAFSPETRETRVTVGGAGEGGRGTVSFFLLGIGHILSGYDHLLFLLGLLLRAGGWFSLIKIITAFTLAHSVTLALAVLNVVVVPDRLVEAVIPASNVFLDPLQFFLSPRVSRRGLLGLCFGPVLLIALSSALRESGL